MKRRGFAIIFSVLALLACQGQAKEAAATQAEESSFIANDKDGILLLTDYEKADSIRIEKLLKEAKGIRKDSLMLHFGKSLMGIPYVAYTLEKNDKERLIVNTRELDCTTFIETCAALSITAGKGLSTFRDYCNILKTLRYRNGMMDGYPSRLHYFCQWVDDNRNLGLVHDIAHEGYPFTATQKIDIHYMSSHPAMYRHLKAHPEEAESIRKYEKAMEGTQVRYIPKALLNQGKEKLRDIRDGDIIVLVTDKDGLDCTHLGMAIWTKGELHLLNASSLSHKVVIYPETLYEYLMKRKFLTGIRVIRIN